MNIETIKNMTREELEFSLMAMIHQAEERERNANDLTYSNCIAYSPSAIREELYCMEDAGYFDYALEDERSAIVWARTTASNEELNLLAQYILSSDSVWTEYNESLMSGLMDYYRTIKKEKNNE